MLSSNELAVLSALWSVDRPLTRTEILQRITKTDWNPGSIHMVLNNLIKKGFVQVGETVRCGQNYGRTYYPLKNRDECIADLTEDILPDASVEERALTFMSAMTKSKGISEAAIREWSECWNSGAKRYGKRRLNKKRRSSPCLPHRILL